MKRVFTVTFFAGIVLLQACKKMTSEKPSSVNPSLIATEKIDDFIREQIRKDRKFEWSTASDEMVWSALQQSDKILSVGYKPAAETNVEERLADIDIKAATWKTARQEVLTIILNEEGKTRQENLGGEFNQGSSTGRTVEKIVTLPRATIFGIPIGSVETPDDGCGHGTSMAGACAAPRGNDGAACGVAYNCNLVVSRASTDVFLDESREVKGAADAYTNAANRTDVKIISMSMGRITSSSQLSDAIKYAYGKGKLLFVAAGTSFSWASSWFGVIFPATLSQVNAVTGVRDNNFNTQCTTCHDGGETDFTVVMEKATSGIHPLSLAMSGDAPSTVGGSSVSTATTAGIAALVWSRFPAYTRDNVLNKMIQSSSRYPNKSSNLGWGNVNADLATTP